MKHWINKNDVFWFKDLKYYMIVARVIRGVIVIESDKYMPECQWFITKLKSRVIDDRDADYVGHVDLNMDTLLQMYNGTEEAMDLADAILNRAIAELTKPDCIEFNDEYL